MGKKYITSLITLFLIFTHVSALTSILPHKYVWKYLDGGANQVDPSNLLTGTLTYITKATKCTDDGEIAQAFRIVPSAFINGDNTIVVETHQEGRASSDWSFDMKLEGTVNSNNQTSPALPNIERYPPTTITTSSLVAFRRAFSEGVTGGDAAYFNVTTYSGFVSGVINSHSVNALSSTGTTYDVTLDSATGEGDICLDLKSAGTAIKNNAGNSVNGGFTSGETNSILAEAISGGFLSVKSIKPLSIHNNTEDKPQSKVWSYNGSWWTVLPSPGTGTYLWRLDGINWTRILELSSSSNTKADCKVVGNVTHILLHQGSSSPSQLVSVEHLPASNTYQLWSQRPSAITIQLDPGVETATLDIDGSGRMWVAFDGTSHIKVRWSDFPYGVWSSPITIGSGVSEDDICAVISMPSLGKVGVIWSDQNRQRFGFKTHTDGANPSAWSADEVPASQSALNVGGGMADDHINMAIAKDGTLYCAVKTRYGSEYPKIALLVRRPSGKWDNLYEVAQTEGTTPIVLLNEALKKLKVIYIPTDSGGDIVYKESDISAISFGNRHILRRGNYLYPTSTKQNYTSDVLVLTSTGTTAHGVLGIDHAPSPPPDVTAPKVKNINRQSPTTETTSASSVTFRATFSEKVTGVDPSDFTVRTISGSVTGSLSANAMAAVGTTGKIYDITVSSIKGTGLLRLDLKAKGTGITDVAGNALVSDFTTGQTYTIKQPLPNTKQYNLTLTTDGNGSVTKSPNQATYASGSIVTLTAKPATNYRFAGWSGEISGTTNPLNVTMKGNIAVTATFTPVSVQQQVLSFTLVNAQTKQDIQTIENGAIINLGTLPFTKLNIRANTSPGSVGSIKFELKGTQSRTYIDNAIPYALYEDDGSGIYYYSDNWNPSITGTYTLTATPYSGTKGSGTTGIPLTINFTFVNQDTSSTSSPSKELKLEVYPNPFTTKATVKINLPEAEKFSLLLYSSKGELVKEVSQFDPGAKTKILLTLDGRTLTPGIYFLRLKTSKGAKTIKLIFNKEF